MLALPFPATECRDESRYSGPGHHLLVLRASRDFWDDPEAGVVREAHRDIEADFLALVNAIAARWGEPETVDLWSYQKAAEPSRPMPQPIADVRMLTRSMPVWRVPETNRWLSLAIGQEDKELPFELLAAADELTTLSPMPSQ
jgi:hypothetical protein